MREALLVRVVVGDDEPLTRKGIVSVLEEAGFEVVGEAAEANDLIRKAKAHKPDVVVTDIQMPPGNADDGLRAAEQIRAAHTRHRRLDPLAIPRGSLRAQARGRPGPRGGIPAQAADQ